MNLETYQKAAERTMLADQPTVDKMMNSALGMCGEAAEIAAAHSDGDAEAVLEECGDAVWYCAQHCNGMGISLGQFSPHRESDALNLLWQATGKLADLTKKEYFHKKEVSLIDRWKMLDLVISAVDTLLGFYGFTLSDACKHNNRKLLRRHPITVGFTTTGANARADEEAPHATT